MMEEDDIERCPTCRASRLRLGQREVERILREYLAQHPQKLVGEEVRASRMAICGACAELMSGTTCRHCGCLVAVLTYLADRQCPRPDGPRWV